MKACASCPARHQADTLDALAQAAEGVRAFRPFVPVLRERAAAIRDAGCTWWWAVQYKHEETGQIKTVELCGGEALPKSLEDFAGEIKLASGTIQAERGETKRATEQTHAAMQQTEVMCGLLLRNQQAIVERLEQVSQRLAEHTPAAILGELDSRGLLSSAGEEVPE